MTQPCDDEPAETVLTRAEVVSLQRAIEAGLLAWDARVSGAGFADATDQELRLLEASGEQARQRFIRANLGLVGMISRQYAARCQLRNCSRKAASAFPLVNYLPVAARARA